VKHAVSKRNSNTHINDIIANMHQRLLGNDITKNEPKLGCSQNNGSFSPETFKVSSAFWLAETSSLKRHSNNCIPVLPLADVPQLIHNHLYRKKTLLVLS